MNKGDRWVSSSHPTRGFRVLEVNKDGSIDVEVDRVIPSREGAPKLERRRRSVSRNDIPIFTLGYEREI